MIDFVDKLEGIKWVKYLRVKYTWKQYPYLVADKYWNFFTLTHCPDKRTIPFKHLEKSKGYVYYHGYKVYLTRLEECATVNIKEIKL